MSLSIFGFDEGCYLSLGPVDSGSMDSVGTAMVTCCFLRIVTGFG